MENKIAEKREEKGLTQKELAEKVLGDREKQGMISFWEGGKRQPSGANMIRLAEALDATPRELYPGV